MANGYKEYETNAARDEAEAARVALAELFAGTAFDDEPDDAELDAMFERYGEATAIEGGPFPWEVR